MAIQSSQNNSSTNGEFNAEYILAEWMKAVAHFHMYHSELVIFINKQRENFQGLNEDSLYVGQCPTESILTLVLVMQGELESLLCDMNQLEWLSQLTSRQHYKKLVDHTQILNLLSNKAHIRLQLIANSAS